ncbi:MAG TPA: hypothetical protein DCP31_21465 [Cyanobacteria bacterium UBA8543]|nr:hypothetical protein [Cyanobacteria bacterium UBA8543]
MPKSFGTILSQGNYLWVEPGARASILGSLGNREALYFTWQKTPCVEEMLSQAEIRSFESRTF